MPIYENCEEWNICNYRIQEILVRLLNEGTDVYKKAKGLCINPRTFILLKPNDYDPDDEDWEYKPGSIIECVIEEHGGKEYMVAAKMISGWEKK